MSANTDDPVKLISDALNQSSQTSGAQVGIAAGAFAGLAVFTLFMFCLLRPNNKIVYQPKQKYAEGDKKPPPLGDGLLSWIPPVLKTTEEEMLSHNGLDAVTFLRFTTMIRNIVTALAVVMCGVLIPVDVAYNLTSGKSSASKQSGLNMLTMADVSGNFIWAHVAMSYIGTIIALWFIYINYRQMVRLRWVWFRSPEYQNALYSRSLMITGVTKQLRSDAALAGTLSSIGMPYPTTDVHISRVVGKLPDLIEEHDDAVRELEHVLAKWLKSPNAVPAKRPTMRIGGFMCCGGREVDAVDYLTKRINALEASVEQWRERIAERKPESYGFAAMASVPFAHAAAKSLLKKKPRGLHIELAPPPKDIIWQNLTLTKAQRFKSSTWGFVLLSILLFINAVPLVAVALISQMERFKGVLPFLAKWQDASRYTFSAVAGLAPPVISGIFGYFLPYLMRRLGKYRGVTTRNKLDRVITAQYFGFLVISQFIVFTLVGVAITSVAQIVNEIKKHESFDSILDSLRKIVLGTVKYQYLAMSNYWLTWIPLRLFVVTFDMSQAIKLVLTWVQSVFFGQTPRDIREFTKPPNFEYAVYYANLLFLFAVGMLYATLAPLVLAFIAVVLWLAVWVYRYIHIYVAVTKNESGGRLWRLVINRLLVCIVFMQVILVLAVALDRAWKAFACLPPVLLVVGFKIYCMRAFDREFDWYIPSQSEIGQIRLHTGDASHHRLARRFGQPSLHQKLFTPMVHAKVKHLLPQVYEGRLEDHGIHDVEGRKAELEEVTGGLKIAAVDEQDCMYDPKLDSDAASVFSATTVGAFSRGPPSRAGTADQNFQDQYERYMAGGNQSTEALEMNAMSNGSHENLLEKSSNSNFGGNFQHGRKGSVGTMLSTSTRPSPGSEMPPGIGAYRAGTPGSMGGGPNGYFTSPQMQAARPGGPPRQDSYGYGPSPAGSGMASPGAPRAYGYDQPPRSGQYNGNGGGPGNEYYASQAPPPRQGTPGSMSLSQYQHQPQHQPQYQQTAPHSMGGSAASMYASAPGTPPVAGSAASMYTATQAPYTQSPRSGTPTGRPSPPPGYGNGSYSGGRNSPANGAPGFPPR
ncbi:unnamed protein product [Sympodiomycopsis kandeliae]